MNEILIRTKLTMVVLESGFLKKIERQRYLKTFFKFFKKNC